MTDKMSLSRDSTELVRTSSGSKLGFCEAPAQYSEKARITLAYPEAPCPVLLFI